MSSILTNNSAMVALQTLKSVNNSLGDVQGQISTGLKVGAAKDNAAVFAISQVMRSDVTGFEAISESMSLGSSTVAVASSAADSIYETLDQIKSKVVSANEDNVDKATIQAEIDSLVEQLTSTVGAAQFNGLNLLDGSNGGTVSFLASMDRDSAGTVTTSSIDIDSSTTNLSTEQGAATIGFAGSDGTLTGGGQAVAGSFAAGAGNSFDLVISAVATDQTYKVTVGDESFSYTAKAGDTATDVGNALGIAMSESDLNVTIDNVSTGGTINIQNDGTNALTISAESFDAGTGGLSAAANIDVTTDAAGALDTINAAIEAVVGIQSSLGTTEKRLEIQSDFLSDLTDSFNSGIGSLVDADMEEASAKLQALQVQQQLATQSLSIANQSPQQLLSLFR